MSAKGSTTMTPWAAGYLDAWAQNGHRRPLRVRNSDDYQRGYRAGDRDRDECGWLENVGRKGQGTPMAENDPRRAMKIMSRT